MTTLDRLFRKGTLKREKSGRAFFYTTKGSQEQLLSQLAGSTFATLLPGDAGFGPADHVDVRRHHRRS